jgi:hypothetical protein
MKFLILTMWLAVMQTPPPIPRQTPDGSASTSRDIQEQTQEKKTPANPAPPLVYQNQPNTTDQNTSQQGYKNTEHPISVSKLPPVTIAPAKRDWVDWGYWGFSGLLALTSIFQVWLLKRTLKINARQAEIAQKQETQMVEAGQQTERIIAQMKETTERDLRAYIGVSKVFLVLTVPIVPVGSVEIQNFGRTPAYKLRQWIGIAPFPYPPPEPLPQSSHTLASIAVVHPGVKFTSIVPLKKPFPLNTKIGTLDLTIYVYGEVIYEDAFGKERHTSFRFIYGGPEGANKPVPSADGKTLLGIMKPDTSGNDAS